MALAYRRMCQFMEIISNKGKGVNVSPDSLESQDSWDSALFVRGQLRFSWLGSRQKSLASTAQVFEGQRSWSWSGDSVSQLNFRASSISRFELQPTAAQWTARVLDEATSLRAGDVVLKRVAPLLAAVVPVGLPMLPVDSSFFVIRGLSEPEGWWAAFCLNHPAFADNLLSKSGCSVLSRVSLSVLRSWPFTQAPTAFSRIARRLTEVLQKRTFLAGRIAALKVEVETAVADQMAATAYDTAGERFSYRSWAFFCPSAMLQESWLPLHVATEFRNDSLHHDSDWLPLPTYLLPDAPPRARFARLSEPIPVLRLSDVGSIPLVPSRIEPSIPLQASRIFSDPIQPEDVLLSTLGSCPRVAFSCSAAQPPIHALDNWERLRFRSYAAAFALILQTGVITRQLGALASGSVQQFIRSDDIRQLFLPVFTQHILANWDRSFRSFCKSWHQTDSEWQAALHEGWQEFCRAFCLPPPTTS